MKRIKLNQGRFALVDNEDFEYLNQRKWHIHNGRYAGTTVPIGNRRRTTLLMHQLIISTPKGLHTDHINQNGLDNRRRNLRVATPSQNILNSKLRRDNRCGVKGVTWNKSGWMARIKINYKSLYLGQYKTLSEATKARERAEKIYGV